MSQQDVNTMRSAYEAFNRGDIPAVLDAFDPEIEWHEPGGGRAPRGTYRGAQSVAQDVFSTVPENFDAFQAEPDQFIDASDHVVVSGHFRGQAKSGQALDVPFVHVWAMRKVLLHLSGHLEQVRPHLLRSMYGRSSGVG